MRKRNKNVYVRFTEDEYKQLMSRIKNSGLSIQSYMIRAALDRKIYGAKTCKETIEAMKKIRDMEYELNKIGTNINQIARWANVKGDVAKYEELMGNIERINNMKEEAQYSWQSLRLSLEGLPMPHYTDV